MPDLLIFELVFALLTLGVVGVLGTAVYRTARLRKAHAELIRIGHRGVATVVDNQSARRSDSDGNSYTVFKPVVVLDNQDDARPVVLDTRRPRSYVVGSRLDVVYDPRDPSRMATLTAPSPAIYAVAAVMGVMLAGFVAFALVGFTVMNRFS